MTPFVKTSSVYPKGCFYLNFVDVHYNDHSTGGAAINSGLVCKVAFTGAPTGNRPGTPLDTVGLLFGEECVCLFAPAGAKREGTPDYSSGTQVVPRARVLPAGLVPPAR
jgi:hypothetical protein